MSHRLVTLNTWKCDGDYPHRLVAMARGLRDLRPDFIALQECFESMDGRHHTALQLARMLDMHCSYLPARRKHRVLGHEMLDSVSGLAVLSRDACVGQGEFPLPGDPLDDDRRGQWVRLALPGCTLTLVNLHLTHLHGRDPLRVQQLAEAVDHCVGSAPEAAILCGDFNAPLSVFAAGGLLSPAGRLEDPWPQVNGNRPRPPTIHERLRDSRIEASQGAIDHVLMLGGSPVAIRCLRSATVLTEPDPETGCYPSDHCGVLLDFGVAT